MKTLISLFSCLLLATITNLSFGQKPFEGMILYDIEAVDTSLRTMVPKSQMRVYTNDTLVRIETENPVFGQQVTIKHLQHNKAYLLVKFNGEKYAIQTTLLTDSTQLEKYEYAKKKKCHKKVLGEKTKRTEVTRLEDNLVSEIIYFKKLRSDLLDVHNKLPGLPAKYILSSKDGDLQYSAVLIEEQKLPFDMFGIPSEFKKVTLEQFLNESIPKEN